MVERRLDSKRVPHRRRRKLVGIGVAAGVLAILVKAYVVETFAVPTASMLPLIERGDRVLVEKLGYLWGSPARGDVVVFEHPLPPTHSPEPRRSDGQSPEVLIKRAVALEGDVIRYEGVPRRLWVNGELVEQTYVAGGADYASPEVTQQICHLLGMPEDRDGCVVPENHFFVMGDNRGHSDDSRVFGPVPQYLLIGHAIAIYWPPDAAEAI